MGTSAKRKKEKRADFQKPKLKVGKAKAKPDNYTDTNFKAKTIVINKQSISASAPTPSHQFSHQLSLLTHKSDTQRRESLAYLTSAIQEKRASSLPSLPLPISVVLARVQPLILDRSRGVREHVLKFLRCLPPGSVAGHANQFLLYTRAGMTHLAAEIRSFALDILHWLLSVAGEEVVVSPGGWARTLRCFLVMFGWQAESGARLAATSGTPATISYGKTFSDSKSTVKQFSVLVAFLERGLGRKDGTNVWTMGNAAEEFPLRHASQHIISKRSDCFAHLNLFGSVLDEESRMYEDREDRQRFFYLYIWPSLNSGIESSKKEGGEIGRAAAQLTKVIKENMADYHENDI